MHIWQAALVYLGVVPRLLFCGNTLHICSLMFQVENISNCLFSLWKWILTAGVRSYKYINNVFRCHRQRRNLSIHSLLLNHIAKGLLLPLLTIQQIYEALQQLCFYVHKRCICMAMVFINHLFSRMEERCSSLDWQMTTKAIQLHVQMPPLWLWGHFFYFYPYLNRQKNLYCRPLCLLTNSENAEHNYYFS